MIGQETGVLFLREVNDNWGWFEDGNKDKDARYIGEFKDGKPWKGTTFRFDGNITGTYTNGKWRLNNDPSKTNPFKL